MGKAALGPLMGTPMKQCIQPPQPHPQPTQRVRPRMRRRAAAAEGALGSGVRRCADLGGLAGLGEAASVGALSVPPSWGWAAAGLPAMLGGVPLTLPGISWGATGGLQWQLGFPLMFPGGLPRTAAAGAAGPSRALLAPNTCRALA